MTIDQLLQDVETLPHGSRVRTMIELGRRARIDPETAALLDELAQGEWYQRFLALYACFGSANAAHVLAALDDPSKILRGLALRLVPLVCTPAQLQQTLSSVPTALRQPLIWKLARHGHTALIDAFVDQLQPDDPQFCQLLRFASEATVLRLVPLFQRRARLAEWSQLARFHPAAVLMMLTQWASAGEQADKPSVQHINTLLPLLIPAQPEQSLQLLTIVLQFIPLHHLQLQALAQRFPVEVAELILAQKVKIELNWQQLVPRLPAQHILDLCAKQKNMTYNAQNWFPLLSLEKRLFIYTHGRRFLLDYYGKDLPYPIIAALPATQREEEARSYLRTPAQQRRAEVSFMAFLPWDEMLAALEPYMHSSDAGLRSGALFAQIEALHFHREQLPVVLERLLQRRTEHDGVRKGILFALVGLPVGFWQEEHLAYLEEIIRHGLNDVGLSQETQRTILKLLLRLLPSHFTWSSQQLQVILKERGFLLPKPGTEYYITLGKTPQIHIEPGLRRELLSLLLPILQTWAQQEKEAEVLDMIEYLAPRGQLPEGVAPLLFTLLQHTQAIAIADQALRLLSHHEPRQFAATILALLQDDASWITRPLIFAYLLRARQDVLTPFLQNQTYSGRFATGRKRFLPALTQSATCLTASQQKRFASALLEQIDDPDQDSQTAVQTVKHLALLPALPVTSLIPLARHQNSLIRTTALFTLSRLDGSEVMPELLAALQDSRARIAIVALRPLLLRMPPAQALAHLRTVPQTRVTVAKETVRLLGELASEKAYRALLALEQQELHRDVRIALLTTLWKHIRYAETWAIMERAIQDPDTQIAVAAIPPASLSWNNKNVPQRIAATGLTWHQHFLRLAALLLQHPERQIRFQILWRYTPRYNQAYRLQGTDSEQRVLPLLAQIIETSSKDECEKAIPVLFALCSPQDSDLVCRLFRLRLHTLDILEEMVDALDDFGTDERLRPIIRAVMDVLATSPVTTLLRLQLAISSFPVAELLAFFVDLVAKNELHAKALTQACEYIDRGFTRFDLSELEHLEKTLAASEDERLRYLALALLLEQAQRAGSWSEAYLARLQQYRADRSLMVATEAQFTFPKEEEV